MEKDLYYIMINVGGRFGYSFIVTTRYNETDDSILRMCLEKDLFQYNEDIDYANVDYCVTERDIEMFKDCIYNLDD